MEVGSQWISFFVRAKRACQGEQEAWLCLLIWWSRVDFMTCWIWGLQWQFLWVALGSNSMRYRCRAILILLTLLFSSTPEKQQNLPILPPTIIFHQLLSLKPLPPISQIVLPFIYQKQPDISQTIMFKRQEDQLTKSIKRYLKKQGRIGFQLKQLNELFKVGMQVRSFNKIFKQQHALLAVFKILMLVHRLTIERSQPMSDLLHILSDLSYYPNDQFEKVLASKLMQPYRLYLQKRIHSYLEPWAYRSKEERQLRTYQLLNLITLATSFSQIIYTFGRYYLDRFTCSIDFNIILGADLQFVYEDMIENVNKPATKDILYEIEAVHEKMYVIYYNCYFYRYLKGYVPKWVITDLLAHKKYASSVRETEKSLSRTATSKGSNFSLEKNKNIAYFKGKGEISQNMAESTLFLNNDRVQQQKQENYELESALHKSCVYFGGKRPSAVVILPNNEEQSSEEDKCQKENQKRVQLLRSMERVVSNFKV